MSKQTKSNLFASLQSLAVIFAILFITAFACDKGGDNPRSDSGGNNPRQSDNESNYSQDEAFTYQKGVGKKYGARDPRTCANTKAPATGAITDALAERYLNCQMEYVSAEVLYMVEDVEVEVGGGVSYQSIRGQRSLNEIDVNQPVYPIRGSLLRYNCRTITPYTLEGENCITYFEPKATGYCYKTTFGDWQCYMSDHAGGMQRENTRENVAPPKS